MPEIASELYPNEDDLTTARPTRQQLNATSGELEAVPISGWADLECFLATTSERTATPIDPTLRVVLAEVGATGAYQGVFEGSAKSTALGALADKAKLFVHWKRAQDYHEVAAVRWRSTPRAVTAP